MSADVHIQVVTYRRPHLLKRALRSLSAQTHTRWVAEVLNDDPADARVAEVIATLGDPRIRLAPSQFHRGAAGNFNHAFRAGAEPYGAILEDDNWWEPAFLATMLAALAAHPGVAVACGNERIWREQAGDQWADTGRTVWPAGDVPELFPCRPVDKCGAAKICNSSLLFRTAGAAAWRTPDSIPVDVTEHFRERVLPHPLLLVPQPLVNYAETLQSHRSQGPGRWSEYQTLLIGSVFALAQPAGRPALAAELWRRARLSAPWAATSLLATGFWQRPARPLWRLGSPREKIRFLAGAARHPRATWGVARARRRHPVAWAFLLQGAFAEFMRAQSAAE